MSKKKRVLVVLREESARAAASEALAQRGFGVTTARDSREAIEALDGVRFDAVLADALLPGLSGFELLAEVVRAQEPKRPLRGLVLEEDDRYGRGRARAEGIECVFVEPLSADDFDEFAAAVLDPSDVPDAVLRVASGKRDRFVRELLRGTQSRSEAVTQKIADPLTGLHHKEFVALELEEEFKRSSRYGAPLSILIVDIDNYEEAKVTHGKAVAQEMLLEAAGVFLCESRDVDRAGRVGESRFLLLLPHTDLEGARTMADRVFQQVCARSVRTRDGEVPIRASVGLASMPAPDVASVDEFVERALKAMRTARNLGGNRICTWQPAG